MCIRDRSKVDIKKAEERYYSAIGTTADELWDEANSIANNPDASEKDRKREIELYDILQKGNEVWKKVPDMAEGDTQRLKSNTAFNTEYDYHPVKLTDDAKINEQKIDSVMNLFNTEDDVSVLIRDHVGSKMHRLSPEVMGELLGEKADQCIMGMCSAKTFAPYWAEGMGTDVISQSDNEKWSGVRKSNSISDINKLFFYDYEDPTKSRHKTYSP